MQINLSFNHLVTILLVFALLFSIISLVMLNLNDHGQANTACTDFKPCLKIMNGVIVNLVFGIFLLLSPYVLHHFLSKNTSLVLKILFAMGLLIGAVIAVAMQVDLDIPSDQLDPQEQAMQAMVYLAGAFGILTSAGKLLELGGSFEKLFKK